MNRVIKFRVHCENTGKVLAYESFNTTLNWGYYWVDATLPEDERICKTLDYFKHPDPLGQVKRVQFTGLHDVNGAEIYEGDIVRVADYDDDERMFLGVVKFGVRGYPAFDIYDKKNETYTDEYNTFTNDNDLTFKVIGNIYEHPHLLEGGK